MDITLNSSLRAAREDTLDVLPASQYLQERLQQRRLRSDRPKKVRQSDFGPRRGRDDDIFLEEAEDSRNASVRMFDSSPMMPESRRGSEAGGSNRRRGLGAKDLDQHMDRLSKQNFALKLELDHRRDQTNKLLEQIAAMQAKVDRADQLQEEHTELLKINSQLVDELEKRDKAVEEAMDIICDLEDQVERNSNTRPSTANADSGYAGTETQEQAPPSSPPEPAKTPKTPHVQLPPEPSAATNNLLKTVNGKTPARMRREPSILSQKKPSTHALRSVYLETAQSLHPVKSFNSLLTRYESKAEDDEEVLNSPRLSVLSESSFPSLYSPKKGISPDRYIWEAGEDEPAPSQPGPSSHMRQDSIKRVSQWMDERDQPDETPSKSNRISSPLENIPDLTVHPSPSKPQVRNGQYLSLGHALTTASKSTQKPSREQQDGVSYIKPFPIRTETKSPRPKSFAGPIFGEPLLPPTPDSVSTRMLRNSRSSIAEDTEKSLLDTTPATVKGYNALEPGLRTAPKQMRSSIELNTAYESYIQRRTDGLFYAGDLDVEDDDADARSETVRDLSLEYDGFPDGGSILMGTPSRFLKHGKPPATTLDDGYELSPTEARSPVRRRQSSSEATMRARKPSLSRAETSPIMIRPSPRVMTGGLQSSAISVTSPRSYHSGSSSNKTIIVSEERPRTISPELTRTESRLAPSMASPPRSRTSASPARTLSQKAHGLLRRMSNTQKDIHSDREKSPLPTLTSTPSSAYINDIVPREMKRPGTSHSGEPNGQFLTRPPSSRDSKRPTMQARTNTAPAPARPVSSSMGDRAPAEKERRNLFKRSNSTKKISAEMPAQNTQPPSQNANGGMREAFKNRRGSLRDAVSATRGPWR